MLDLRSVEFIGSAGMAVLITTHQLRQDQHVGFRVVAGRVVTRRLELLDLLTLVIVCRTLGDALQDTGSDVPTMVT